MSISDFDFTEDTYHVYEDARVGIYLYGSEKASMLFEIANKNDATDKDIQKFKNQVLLEIGFK